MEEYIQKSRQIIEENIYCTISTASLDGKPWISPVFFAYDEQYNLYWVSYKDALHSKLLRTNPQAAIVIFDSKAPEGKGDGVYFEVTVEQLSNKEDILKGIEILGNRVSKDEFKVKKLEEVEKDAVWRIYKATPHTISKLTEGTFINGQYVDKRVEVKLR